MLSLVSLVRVVFMVVYILPFLLLPHALQCVNVLLRLVIICFVGWGCCSVDVIAVLLVM